MLVFSVVILSSFLIYGIFLHILLLNLINYTLWCPWALRLQLESSSLALTGFSYLNNCFFGPQLASVLPCRADFLFLDLGELET